ncbi:hypothetical protein RCH20_000026 [Psychrobacter sp. PL15]|uniref:hypothetical protein n=1 Tax=Psychrobacter sp. PL15 TaxID=3071719 RepID=UPI002E0A83A4|nr:hypothetical protein [Psychrobacter sp. PL15]
MNKSVADYVDEHLKAQDEVSETDTKSINTSNNSGDFSDTELAASINPERLNALLHECDNFLALAEHDMADFDNTTVKSVENVINLDKKTSVSNK